MVSAVYRGDEAKPSVQTCTCVHRTCNGYGVTGDRYGVGQSHPRCDPCYTLAVGRRWPWLAAMGFCGPALAAVGLRGPAWAFVGRRWLPWVFVGLHCPSLAVVGCCGPSWACVGLRWPSLAVVGCWVTKIK